MSEIDVNTIIRLQEELNVCLKNPSTVKNFKSIFVSYTTLLKKSYYRAHISKINRKCERCSKPPSSSVYYLPCKHLICSTSCYHELVETSINTNLSRADSLRCPCGEKIPKSITIEAFGGQELFSQKINEDSAKFDPILTCNICGSDLPAGEFITFDCDHRFCKMCVKMSLDYLINEGKVGDEINCPECSVAVAPQIIYTIIDDETREKYDRFLIMNLMPEKSGERFIMCIGRPGIDCRYAEFISVDREVYTCKECGVEFCPKCKLSPHPKLTCEQKKVLNNCSEPHIKEALENGTMKMCSWCQTPIERSAGCKYITCQSEYCKGKRYFCWDCNAKLSDVHQVHDCITKDVISNRIKQFFRRLF